MKDDDRANAILVIELFAENVAARAVACHRNDDTELYNALRVVVQVASAAAEVIETFGKVSSEE